MIAMAMKPNALAVWNFINENDGADFTATDIAEALNLEVKSVNGILTSAFQKKGLTIREEAEVELADGSHKKVKFIRLTEKGKAFTPDAE
jgi:DNA-binding MarR family transcriptional regulator